MNCQATQAQCSLATDWENKGNQQLSKNTNTDFPLLSCFGFGDFLNRSRINRLLLGFVGLYLLLQSSHPFFNHSNLHTNGVWWQNFSVISCSPRQCSGNDAMSTCLTNSYPMLSGTISKWTERYQISNNHVLTDTISQKLSMLQETAASSYFTY